jgi:uncharacterized RDD family membrane protein YckC
MLALALLVVAVGVTGFFAAWRRVRDGVPALREMDEATADALVAEVLSREPKPGSATEPADARAPADSAATPATNDDDASIPERFIAFGIDLSVVLGATFVVRERLDLDPVAYLQDDPIRSLAVLAWLTLGFVFYLTVFEAILGWTPGKYLLGLEVRTVEGERPPLLARLYRNLFRVELLFFATPIAIPVTSDQHLLVPVPLLALIFMMATPRNQRPGDWIAGTVVQRARPTLPEPEEDAQPATTGEDED